MVNRNSGNKLQNKRPREASLQNLGKKPKPKRTSSKKARLRSIKSQITLKTIK